MDSYTSVSTVDIGPGDYYVTAGTYLVVTSTPVGTNKKVWSTLEWSEEI